MHRGAGLYIAVKNETTVTENVTEAKNGQKLLGIQRVRITSLVILYTSEILLSKLQQNNVID